MAFVDRGAAEWAPGQVHDGSQNVAQQPVTLAMLQKQVLPEI